MEDVIENIRDNATAKAHPTFTARERIALGAVLILIVLGVFGGLYGGLYGVLYLAKLFARG